MLKNNFISVCLGIFVFFSCAEQSNANPLDISGKWLFLAEIPLGSGRIYSNTIQISYYDGKFRGVFGGDFKKEKAAKLLDTSRPEIKDNSGLSITGEYILGTYVFSYDGNIDILPGCDPKCRFMGALSFDGEKIVGMIARNMRGGYVASFSMYKQ